MTEKECLKLLWQDKHMMVILKAIADLPLADVQLAAGGHQECALSDRPAFNQRTAIDAVFYDKHISHDISMKMEQDLKKKFPQYQWEVRNQAHMNQHSPNTLPYRSTCDAIKKYPETCTAIAIRLNKGVLECFAPYGLEAIVHFEVRPTPHFLADKERMLVYRERLTQKHWSESWPSLQFLKSR